MDNGSREEAAPRNNRALTNLLDVFRSGRPLVYIRSAEEGRVAGLLREASKLLHPSAPIPVWAWSLTEGLVREDAKAEASALAHAPALAKDPLEALDFIAAHNEPGNFPSEGFPRATARIARSSPPTARPLRPLPRPQ